MLHIKIEFYLGGKFKTGWSKLDKMPKSFSGDLIKMENCLYIQDLEVTKALYVQQSKDLYTSMLFPVYE